MGMSHVRVVTSLDDKSSHAVAPCLIVSSSFVDDHPLHFFEVESHGVYSYIEVDPHSASGDASIDDEGYIIHDNQLHGLCPITYSFINDTPEEHPYIRLMQMYLAWMHGGQGLEARKRMIRLITKRYGAIGASLLETIHTVIEQFMNVRPYLSPSILPREVHPDDRWQEL
jgi:hypothetical protein